MILDGLRDRLYRRLPARIVDPGAAQAAVAVILVPALNDLEILFIRRASHDRDPWSGHMALPGGRRQVEDRALLDTAVRETNEETGIRLEPADVLGDLDDFTPRTPVLPAIVIRPFVFGLQTRPVINKSPEVAYHRWIPVKQLVQASATAHVEIHGTRTPVSAYVVGDDVIWGLTERIIRPLLELIP